MSNKNDLDILIPDNEITLASGEKVVVRPFPFAKLPVVTGLVNQVGRGVLAIFEATVDAEVSEEKPDGTATLEFDDTVISRIHQFIANQFDAVIELMAIYCGRQKEFFLDEENGPNFEEACQIILLIVARNLNFFMKTLRPVIASARSSKLSQAGVTLSGH